MKHEVPKEFTFLRGGRGGNVPWSAEKKEELCTFARDKMGATVWFSCLSVLRNKRRTLMTLEVLTPPNVTDQRKINLQFQHHDLIYLLVNMQNIADLHSGLSQPIVFGPKYVIKPCGTCWKCCLCVSFLSFSMLQAFTVCGVASIVLRGNAASLTGLVVMQLYTSMCKCMATLIFHHWDCLRI